MRSCSCSAGIQRFVLRRAWQSVGPPCEIMRRVKYSLHGAPSTQSLTACRLGRRTWFRSLLSRCVGNIVRFTPAIWLSDIHQSGNLQSSRRAIPLGSVHHLDSSHRVVGCRLDSLAEGSFDRSIGVFDQLVRTRLNSEIHRGCSRFG
jgi:hypothetical protein